MNKRRVYSTNSRGKVYHFPGCRYAVRIPEKYAARQTKHSLDSAGYRPCRCCNVMKFRVEREFQGLSFYCKDKNMEFQLKSGILYVETEIGCWKLVYRDDLQNFALYHRNDTGQGYKIISLFSNIYDKISYKDIYGQYGYGYCLWNVCYGF